MHRFNVIGGGQKPNVILNIIAVLYLFKELLENPFDCFTKRI